MEFSAKMTIDEQVAVLMQGTEYGDVELKNFMAEELRKRLVESEKSNRPLRVYCGYDPRTTDLHLGHTITMHKLRQFQELGHHVIFLIGTYTSLIGDPSDQDKLRKQLTPEQVEFNARTFAEQSYRILDEQKTEVRYNAEWLSTLTFEDLIRLASNFTLQQFVSRDNFRQRWQCEDAIYLHETFYAIMQGYDAYTLRADVQVGGTDQLFNIVTAARKLTSFLGGKPNIAIITGILPGTDGEIRMSKSLGNHIPLNTTPKDMYGKLMSIPDKAMGQYFRLLTRLQPEEIQRIEEEIKNGTQHPRDVKMKLAHEIVEIYYGKGEAERAEQDFVRVFQEGSTPKEMPTYILQPGQTILAVLTETGLAKSKNEGRRLIDQKGIKLDGVVLEDPTLLFPHPGVLQVGKRRFLHVIDSQ